MELKLNLGIIFRRANTWWNIDFIASQLKRFPKVNVSIIDVTEYDSTKIPKNLHCITLLPHESDVIEDFIMANKDLKWIHCMWSGVDKFLCKPTIKNNDSIILTNGRGAFRKSLAEYAMFSMLYFSYHVPLYNKVFSERGWVKPVNTMLDTKTLTIVGYGWNGVEIAKKAKLGFNMNVVGIKRNINNVDGREFIDEIFTLDELPEIIPKSDFLLNILPQTPETDNLYDYNLLQLMKPSAVFINIGRGATVKEEDLIQILKEGKIKGAALDVFKQEPLDPKSEFYDLDNVVLSFHSCDNTDDYFRQGVDVFTSNLESLEKKGEYITIVDKEKGY